MRKRNFGQRFSRNLRFENLERRIVLAGNVTVNVAAGVLTIAGDTANNEISVTQGAAADSFIVTGNAGTTINNAAAVTTTGVTGNIVINMSNGDDQVILLGITTPSNLQVDGDGDGTPGPAQNDTVYVGVDPLNANAIGAVTVNGTLAIGEMSTVVIDSTHVTGATTIGQGPTTAANNLLDIADSTFDSTVGITGGNVISNYAFDRVSTLSTTLNAGTAADTLNITDSSFGTVAGTAFSLTLGGGGDTLQRFEGNTVNGDMSITGAAGTDVVNIGTAPTAGNLITGSLTVALGAGTKTIHQALTTVDKNETITGTTGANNGSTVSIVSSTIGVAGALVVGTLDLELVGDAADTLTSFANNTVNGNLILNGGAGAGADVFNIGATNGANVAGSNRVTGDLTVTFTGVGAKAVNQDAATVLGSETISGGTGGNTVNITNSQVGTAGGNDALHISLNSGVNKLDNFANNLVTGNLTIDDGTGADTINLGVAGAAAPQLAGFNFVTGNLGVTFNATGAKTLNQDNLTVLGTETITAGTGVTSSTIKRTNVGVNLVVNDATGAAGGLIHVESSHITGNATLTSGANGDTLRFFNGTVNGTLIADGGAGADSITIGDATANATTAVTAGVLDILAGAGADTVRVGFNASPVIVVSNLIVNLGAEADTLAQIFTTVLNDETVTHTGATGSVGLTRTGVVGDLSVQIGEAAFGASNLSVVGTMTVDAGTVNMINSLSVKNAFFTGGDVNVTGITINQCTFGENLYLRGRATGQNHLTLLNSLVAKSAVVNKNDSGVTIATQQNVVFFNTNRIYAVYVDGGTGVDNVSVLASISQGIFASLGTSDDSMNISNTICPNGQLDGGAGTNTLLLNNTSFTNLTKPNFK